MTHPHQLHAAAALWSLRAARGRLHQAAVDHAHLVPDVHDDCLRSPVYGSRGSGGHGDPTANYLVAYIRPNRAAELGDSITATLDWLARRLTAPGDGDPLGRLHTALPGLRPASAGELHRWLADLDKRARAHLHLPPDHRPLTGAACPACGIRQLYLQTSAPDPVDRTVICTAGCTCAGDDCTCDMPTKAEGVIHIWGSTSGLLMRHLVRLEA